MVTVQLGSTGDFTRREEQGTRTQKLHEGEEQLPLGLLYGLILSGTFLPSERNLQSCLMLMQRRLVTRQPE